MAGPYTTPDTGSWFGPSLTKNPGLATDVLNTTDNPVDAGTVTSQSNNIVTTVDALQQHIANNNSQSFWQKIGGAGWNTLNFLGKPLQDVQRDYKFIHAMYTDHGILAGLTATLGVAGGAVGGALLAGPGGGAIGADLTATAIRKMFGSTYQDSYNKSADPNYKVSFGRDTSNFLGSVVDAIGAKGVGQALKNTNTGLGAVVSGATDMVGDVTADPFMILGKANLAMKTGRYLNPVVAGDSYALQAKYPLQRVIPGIENFLTSHSMRTFSPDQIDAVWNGGKYNLQTQGYRRAAGAMADIGRDAKSTTLLTEGATPADLAAARIAFHFPVYGPEAAGRLGALVTQDIPKSKIMEQINDFNKMGVYIDESKGATMGAAILPSRTLLHPSVSVADYLRDQLGMAGKIYKTWSGYMPHSIDPTTGKISTDEFNWKSPDAVSVIYRENRFSQGHQYALEMAGQYATAVASGDLNAARLINANSTFDMLKKLGLPDDNYLVKNIKDTIDRFSSEEPSGAGQYGHAPSERGGTISDYSTLDGTHANAALFEHQASEMLPIPNYLTVQREVRNLGLIKGKLGYLDDTVANLYTNKIFKPLALATAGFGLRVSASEMLLAVSRYGAPAMIASKIASMAAKQGYELAPGEKDSFVSSVLNGLGVGKALKVTAKTLSLEKMYAAVKLASRHEGSILQDSISSAGHSGAPADSYDAEQNLNRIFQKQKVAWGQSNHYDMFDPEDPQFLGRYATQLAKARVNPAQKNIAADISWVFRDAKNIEPSVTNPEYMALRNRVIDQEEQRILDTKAGKYPTYMNESKKLDRWVNQDPREFAADRVDAVLGLGIGKDGTINHNIFQGIKDNRKFSLDDLKAIPKDTLPAQVAGAAIGEPIINPDSLMTRVISQGFKKVFNPIINNLSREPLYVSHVTEEFKSMQYAIKNGMLTEDQAFTIAETRAAHAMLPQIHNPMLKTQMAVSVRNFFPFYFAQEQAWKRTIAAMKDTSVLSPIFSRTVREFQMVEQTMADPTFTTTDANGNKYANMPLVGEWGRNLQSALAHFGVPMVSGLPLTVSGSLSSLKSVVPEMNKLPGVSPIVAVSMNFLSDLFPAWQPAIGNFLGQSANRGFWDTINPNAFSKTVWHMVSPDVQDTVMANAVFGALASAYYHGDPGFNPQASDGDKQDLIDRVRNNARSILAMKAALQLLSPLAPKVEQVDSGLRDEFLKLVKEKGDYVTALQAFLKEHGTKALSYTISQTTAAIPGAKFPYVQESLDWIDSHKNLLHNDSSKNPTSIGAAFLIPQNPGPKGQEMAIFNDLLHQHLRTRRDPKDLITQFYISEADQYFNPLKAQHDKIIADATANMDQASMDEENAKWSGVMDKMKNIYPDWYTLYNANGSKTRAAVALSQFRTIFARPDAPTNEQSNLVRTLVQGYDHHRQIMIDAKQNGDTYGAKDEKTSWTDYLQNAMKVDPRLKPVINSVFLKLD